VYLKRSRELGGITFPLMVGVPIGLLSGLLAGYVISKRGAPRQTR
jgi:hypothetical protein